MTKPKMPPGARQASGFVPEVRPAQQLMPDLRYVPAHLSR